MQAFEPQHWQFVEALYEDKRPITLVKCTFGLVVVEDDALPFTDPLVSKAAALDTEHCHLAYLLEDRFSDCKVFQVWRRLPYRRGDFIEQLAEFLSSSGLLMTVAGDRERAIREVLQGRRTVDDLPVRHSQLSSTAAATAK
jgi:hypothetical protein